MTKFKVKINSYSYSKYNADNDADNDDHVKNYKINHFLIHTYVEVDINNEKSNSLYQTKIVKSS